MQAKDFLKDLRTQDYRLRSIEEAILVLESKATKVTSAWKDIQVTGGVNDGIAGIVVKLIETQQKYIREWDRLIDDRNAAERLIAKMENKNHATLLWLYYVRMKNWEQVAEIMSFSISYVFTMHGVALAEFQRIVDESWNT